MRSDTERRTERVYGLGGGGGDEWTITLWLVRGWVLPGTLNQGMLNSAPQQGGGAGTAVPTPGGQTQWGVHHAHRERCQSIALRFLT